MYTTKRRRPRRNSQNRGCRQEGQSHSRRQQLRQKGPPPCLRKQLGHSLAIRQARHEALKICRTATWATSPRYRHTQLQDVLTPYLQKFLKHEGISRKTAGQNFQLRVGHALLNDFLFRFKRVDNPRCTACRHPKETVEHVLLYFPSYTYERWPIAK
jgi:hypothetical protein